MFAYRCRGTPTSRVQATPHRTVLQLPNSSSAEAAKAAMQTAGNLLHDSQTQSSKRTMQLPERHQTVNANAVALTRSKMQ